jgi:hypothetical protein
VALMGVMGGQGRTRLLDAFSDAMLKVGNSRGDGRAGQYSSASMMVSTLVVTEGSAALAEWATIARSK